MEDPYCAEASALAAVMDEDEPRAEGLLGALAGHELRALALGAERLAQMCRDADSDPRGLARVAAVAEE